MYNAGRDLHLTLGSLSVPATGSRSAPITYDRGRPLFVQYLNPEVLACYGLRSGGRHTAQVLARALSATRAGVLLTDAGLTFPASYVFEAPCFPAFLREISPLIRLGEVSYTSPVRDLDDYRAMKLPEYRSDPVNPYARRRRGAAVRNLMWRPRLGGTTHDITTDWHAALAPDGWLNGVVEAVGVRWKGSTTRLEEALHSAPRRLEGQAMIGRFLEKTLPVGITPRETARIDIFLSRGYLLSYLSDLGANMLFDSPWAALSCGISPRQHSMQGLSLLSVRRFNIALNWLGLDTYVYEMATFTELVGLRSLPEFSALASAIYDHQESTSLRSAVIKIRGSGGLKPAGTLEEARRNVFDVVARF